MLTPIDKRVSVGPDVRSDCYGFPTLSQDGELLGFVVRNDGGWGRSCASVQQALYVYSLVGGKRLHRVPLGGIEPIQADVNPDLLKAVYVAGDEGKQVLRTVDLVTGQQTPAVALPQLPDEADYGWGRAHFDGDLAAVCLEAGSTWSAVLVLDLRRGKLNAQMVTDQRCLGLAGDFIATTNGSTVTFHDLKLKARGTVDAVDVIAAAGSDGGPLLLLARTDSVDATVYVVDSATLAVSGSLSLETKLSTAQGGFAALPGGFAIEYPGHVTSYDNNGVPVSVWAASSSVHGLSNYSPEGELLAVAASSDDFDHPNFDGIGLAHVG